MVLGKAREIRPQHRKTQSWNQLWVSEIPGNSLLDPILRHHLATSGIFRRTCGPIEDIACLFPSLPFVESPSSSWKTTEQMPNSLTGHTLPQTPRTATLQNLTASLDTRRKGSPQVLRGNDAHLISVLDEKSPDFSLQCCCRYSVNSPVR